MQINFHLNNAAKDYFTRFYCILDEMIQGMTEVELTGSISHNFIVQMIPHHEGAVKMSENALMFCTCPELIPILQSIITSQKRGIMQMQQLLKCFRQLMIS